MTDLARTVAEHQRADLLQRSRALDGETDPARLGLVAAPTAVTEQDGLFSE
jgi:hypothetical protein